MSLLNCISKRLVRGTICSHHARLFSSPNVYTTSERHHAEEHAPQQSDIHDIIITGGGMVGAAMTAALGESYLKVLREIKSYS